MGPLATRGDNPSGQTQIFIDRMIIAPSPLFSNNFKLIQSICGSSQKPQPRVQLRYALRWGFGLWGWTVGGLSYSAHVKIREGPGGIGLI